MRFASRVAIAAALVFALSVGGCTTAAPLMHADAQKAGKTLAMDFRMTNSVQGSPDTGLIVGHTIGTTDKMRLEVLMRGTNARVTPLGDSAVSMIVTDSGKTITYLDSKKSQFLRVRPAEMVAQAQQMGGMKMDFSETSAKVDSLGAGPVILGHADERGSDTYNMGLSEKRARAVKDYLTSHGVSAVIKVVAKGKRDPLQIEDKSGMSKEDIWALNRRVEWRRSSGQE